MGHTTTFPTKSVSLLSRYQQVFKTLIKYGFEDVLAHPPLNRIVPQTNVLVPSRAGRKVSQFTRYERLRLLCEELGTTFIKFAQIASNRPDLLPEELVRELVKLQDQVAPVSFVQIKAVLEAELLRPLDELLDDLDEQPLASASVAQVHRARLLGGQEVVLKVQRPGLRGLIEADVAILWQLVGIVEQHFPSLLVYQPRELVKMFEQSITEELNFRREAQHLLEFQEMFRQHPDVFVPKLYAELSSMRVLCLEYVDGYKITDLEALEAYGQTGPDLALRGIRLYFEQIFEHGFFHADPHPGNIFVLRDGRIAFLDFGMMGRVGDEDKVRFANILLAVYERDVEGLKRAILKFSSGLSKEQEQELEYDIIYFLRQYGNIALEDIDGNEVLQGLNAMFYLYKIKMPANILLLLKALVIIEGVGLRLDPQYDMVANIGPFVQRLMLEEV
jgi:ubiquinone biosynthesis protein